MTADICNNDETEAEAENGKCIILSAAATKPSTKTITSIDFLAPASSLSCAVVLISSFMCVVIIFGISLSTGVFVVEYRDYFGCSRKEAATAGALVFGFSMMIGPFAGYLYRKYGCRNTVMLGGWLAAVGYAAAYFATNLPFLFATQSVVGCGIGIASLPTISVQAEYFKKQRFFATAILSAGGSVGGILFPPFYLSVIEQYSLHGSMLINAGVALHIMLLGGLLKSRIRWNKAMYDTALTKEANGVNKNSVPEKANYRRLLFNTDFILFCLNSVFWGSSTYCFFNQAVELMTERELSISDASYVLMISALVSLVVRILGSFTMQSRCTTTNLSLYYTICILIMDAGFFAIVVCQTFTAFALSCSLVSVGMGLAVPALAPLQLSLFSLRDFASVLGYGAFAVGIGGLIGSFLAGLVGDLCGSTSYSFYLIAANGLTAAALSFCIFLRHCKSSARS